MYFCSFQDLSLLPPFLLRLVPVSLSLFKQSLRCTLSEAWGGGDDMPTLCSQSPQQVWMFTFICRFPLSQGLILGTSHAIVSKALWSLPGGPGHCPRPSIFSLVLMIPCQSHCLCLSYFSTTPKPVHHSFHFGACGALSRHS